MDFPKRFWEKEQDVHVFVVYRAVKVYNRKVYNWAPRYRCSEMHFRIFE